MGILDVFKPRKKEMYELAAEKAGYEEKMKQLKSEEMEKRIERARQRGTAKATPAHKRIGKGILSAGESLGKTIQSQKFQSYAQAGAMFMQEPRKKKTKRGKKGRNPEHSDEYSFGGW